MTRIPLGEIFNKLHNTFIYITGNCFYIYKEPFKVMYNNDKDFNNSTVDNIIYYFMDHYIKETDIIIKNYGVELLQTVWDKFYDYLYTLGINIDKDYKPRKADYIIKYVISKFIIENKIDLTNYIKNFQKLHIKEKSIENIHNSIDIVNYFISTNSRPWKSWYEYWNEFMDFLHNLDVNYERPVIINMNYNEVCDLVKEYFNRDVKSQPSEVQQLYFDMWNELYSHDDNGNYNCENLIYDYFINTYYKPWKYKYVYEHEWKDYIETLNID